ncbi:MAG: hypothetical protein EBS70_03795 [Actinobacteria bacterium]|jgi:hypothetical protein|nr:hypothetical protein [Actinomycetota bacterium]NBY12536.1 hypothetical protein [Actinomycetota bacterium]NDD86308.1 hypothetical protein [Actinomycetota bacterium]NDF41024.1 hypothetical protein [Actinomycetota bacterium]
MYWRRPRNSTLVAIAIFVVSFAFWLGQPQPDSPSSGLQIPDVSWVFVTTTVAPPVDTSVPTQTTIPTETSVPTDTVPVETTIDPAVTTLP